MAKLQVSLQKQGWVLPQALLEHFAAHQQMSLSFECVSITDYQKPKDEIIKGNDFERAFLGFFFLIFGLFLENVENAFFSKTF